MDYHDPEWAAERLGVDKNTLYKFLHEGTIPAIQLGRKWLISEVRLVSWLEGETDRQTQARRSSIRSVNRAIRQMSNLAVSSRALLRDAYAHARRLGHRHLGLEHLLLAVLGSKDALMTRLITQLGIGVSASEPVAADLEIASGSGISRMGRKPLARRAMKYATEEADSKLIEPGHLLLGILRAAEPGGLPGVDPLKITHESVRRAMKALKSNKKEEP